MAELKFKARGKRWPALARRVAADNPGTELIESGSTITVRGPCIIVTREMVEETCFLNGPRNPGTPTRLLYGLALLRTGHLVARSNDRIVIGDDDGERAMSVRLRVDHQQAIKRLAERLKMSRNEFVVQAVEHFTAYLDGARDLDALDEEPG